MPDATQLARTATSASSAPPACRGTSLALARCLALAGWEVAHIDVDLTGERPKAEIKLERRDGRWLLARVDRIGRATLETFQRERSLGMSRDTTGRRPLAPQVDDIFLGRQTSRDARHMLLTVVPTYVADNATSPVALADVLRAWGAVLGAPAVSARALEAIPQS